MSRPRVSVIIPTYKHRDYVLQALDSVFAQTFTDYEVIVVNDGSPDDTAQTLQALIAAGKIKYIEQANAGQSAARNRGIQEATGEFIALLDDDDLWPADKLAHQVAAMEANPGAVVVYGAMQVIGGGPAAQWPQGTAPSGDVLDAFCGAGWIRSPGQTLIRASTLREIGGFDRRIWGTDDWDLWLRLARIAPFVFQPEVALYYRCHETNASRQFFRMHRNGMKVVRKHFGIRPIGENARKWSMSRRFVKEFAANDGRAEIARLLAANQRRSAFKAWVQVVWIKATMMGSRRGLRELVFVIAPRTSIWARRQRWMLMGDLPTSRQKAGN